MGVFNWLSAWAGWLGTRSSRRPRPPVKPRLACEMLETRLAPAVLTPLAIASPDPNGIFGSSVAVSGTNVVVSGAGVAYLYTTSGKLLQTFHNPNASFAYGFGATVAISDNEVLIGAPGQGAGYAYLFTTSGKLLHTYHDPLGQAEDNFGVDLAISGNDVLIGAKSSAAGGTDAAYLFNTAGQLRHTFVAQDQAGFANHWIALSGNEVLIGSVSANQQTGVARLYDTNGALLHTFTDPQVAAQQPDWFGGSVSLSGGNVLIGAEDANGTAGIAYLYNTSGKLLRTFQAPGSGNGDFFGSTAVLSGNNVLIAAMDAYANPGVAYLFNTSGQLLRTFANPNPVKNDGFASTVAMSGSLVAIGSYGSGYVGGSVFIYKLGVAPVIVANPISQTVNAYQTVTFTATSTGTPAPNVQWQVSTDGGKTFKNLAGRNASTLSFFVFSAYNGWEIRAVLTNAGGTVTTNAAVLTVRAPTLTTKIG